MSSDVRCFTFRLISKDSKNISSLVTQVTVVECPACVNGHCDHATAERIPGASNAYYKNASCTCNLGYTGNFYKHWVKDISNFPLFYLTFAEFVGFNY